MRPPTERDQCQAKLDILIEGFMRADWTAHRDATAWLRDFADQKNIERGRAMFAANGASLSARLILEIDMGKLLGRCGHTAG